MIQQVGVVIRDLATAVEQLSREVDDLKNTCGTSSARPTTTSKTSSRNAKRRAARMRLWTIDSVEVPCRVALLSPSHRPVVR
jgi:predicted RecB family endonuclease